MTWRLRYRKLRRCRPDGFPYGRRSCLATSLAALLAAPGPVCAGQIGDRLEVGAVSGTVADMNLSYVVLQHPDQSHTLVPYAVLKASPFTVLSQASDKGASQ